MDTIMESVPNFSEGRNQEVVEILANCFRRSDGVRLLDCSADPDHHRSVFTVVGEPDALRDAIVLSVGTALERIDLRKHQGQHPFMGAADVIPFIPIRGCGMEDADKTARETARIIAEKYHLPVFLYEYSATAKHRENLSDIRRGGFFGMAEKMKDPAWQPDYGPKTIHPTGGVTAVGARMPLIAFNINLDTDQLEIADKIARLVRFSSGRFPCVKAIGIRLDDRGIVQVSMNLTDYTKTGLYTVFEAVRAEAARFGVTVAGSELIGLAPLKALTDFAAQSLKLERFSVDQVLETRL